MICRRNFYNHIYMQVYQPCRAQCNAMQPSPTNAVCKTQRVSPISFLPFTTSRLWPS